MLRNLKQFNLPEIEEKVLKYWKENNTFKKSLDKRKNAKPFKFFEGPPTANGRPGLHHVLARAFKDIILRFKTMKGFFVLRRAGWDTHGLPVELEVEKKLGIKNKAEIEKFGIAEFNNQAKMSVWTYKGEWEKLTERIGFWLDMDHPYVTYENNYVESLWWVFGEIAKRGLLKKLYKVVPWCPRCQTPLSSHELGQPGAYKLTKDPSVYVKFKLKGSKSRVRGHEYLLVWTTTPWTLPANVAVAVDPKLTYTKYKVGDDYFWSYNAPPKVEGLEMEVVEKISGRKLVGKTYEPFYKNEGKHQVIAGDFVSTEDGTGLVHIAPAYGEDDLRVAGQGKIPVTIDDAGKVKNGLPGAGKFIKSADPFIIKDLQKRGLMHYATVVEHEYPYCWRCSTPLIYFARNSWFIQVSKLRNELIANNKKINWTPEHIKEGRFGEWLREVKDWAISRDRYWGTPLPIWECAKNSEHRTFVGALADLTKHAYQKNKFYISRHGEAESNLLEVSSKSEKDNHKLTDKGIKQIEKNAKELKKKKIQIIYSSPYLRTKQTAKIYAKHTKAKIIFDKRLSEIGYGVLGGKPMKEYYKFFGQDSYRGRFTKTPPGGESLNDVKKRVVNFLQDINAKYKDKNILIVGHGDPLWIMSGASKGYNNEDILNKQKYIAKGEYRELELRNLPLNADGELDMHRPYIDRIHLKCEECSGKMTRIKGIADVWFDSGAMPFAQWHYPFENKKLIDSGAQFPADYIVEAMDQTRGWFYTLLAVSTLLSRGIPYKNVISFGLLLDKNGQKMSKSKGNVINPWDMANKYGADVLRWHFYTVNAPGEPKRFDENDLAKTMRRLFFLAYNSFAFYSTYGKEKSKPNVTLDKWIMARLNQTIEGVTKNLDNYNVGDAGKLIEELVDDLSRWYIRRSRKNVSGKTLQVVLENIGKLMAPFAPFFGEALFQSVTNKKSSVHLEDWPVADKKKIDKSLLEKMAEVRRLSSLALAEREQAGIKVRQPLGKLSIKSKKLLLADKELLLVLRDEVNVKEIVLDKKIKAETVLDTKITDELKAEGLLRDLARTVQGLRGDAKYQPSHKISLMLELPSDLLSIIKPISKQLQGMVNAKLIEFKRGKFDAETDAKLNGQPIWVAVRRV